MGTVPETRQSALVTLLFTDVVGSTALKQQLGDHARVAVVQEHHAMLRDLLKQFPQAEEISSAGDSFFLVFINPSEAVRFALLLMSGLRKFNEGRILPLYDRVGLHLGEVVIEQTAPGKRDLHGMQVDTCARVMSLAQAGQILMTRPVFDNARQSLKGEEVESLGVLGWLNHGRFELKGVDEPLEICEVRSTAAGSISAPTTSEKARRVEAAEGEAVLGWRPAVGQVVPNTKWVLEEKLGEGGFGEVWLGRHQTMKERRVFKFCFRADRVRSLKREMTLFRLIKERIGDHPNIVALREVYFDEPPYYVEEEYVSGQDLTSWCAAQGGVEKVPLEVKLEIVAQVGDALQAAHDAGVIHRDVKPANILVSARPSTVQHSTTQPEQLQLSRPGSQLLVKLTDFGIGQVVSAEALAGVTKAGFTQTMLGSTSSQTGTQLYMAPELLAGKPATTRSDIYSLGVVLYQLLVGDFQRPVTIDWAQETSDPLLGDDLKRCFARRPEERFPGAGQLATNLRTWEQRKAEVARRQAEQAERDRLRREAAQRHRVIVISTTAGAALLVLAAALGFGFWRTEQARDLAEANAYAADMNVVQQALLTEDLGRARTLLDRYRPGSGREYLRGFEWRYLAAAAGSEYVAANRSSGWSAVSMALSPNGRTLAVVRGWRDIELWDPSALQPVVTLETNVGESGCVAFSPVGRLLATFSERNGGINLWQLDPPQIVARLPYDKNDVFCLCFSPDGRHLASASPSGTWLWDLQSRQSEWCRTNVCVTGEHPGGTCCFSPDGLQLAVGERSGHIRILDWAANRELRDITAHDQFISSLAYSPDGKLLASGSGYSTEDIRLWDVGTGQAVGSLAGHRAWISALKFSADGQRLFSASADQTIGIWDVPGHRLTRKLRGHLDEVWSVAFDDRSTNLISGGKDGTLARWDVDQVRQHALQLDLPGRKRCPTYTGSGSSVAVLDEQGAVALWSSEHPQQLSVITALGSNNVGLAIASRRGLLACTTLKGPILIWSLQAAKLVTNLDWHPGRAFFAYGLRFSKGEDFLLASSPFGGSTIWDATTWKKRSCITETNHGAYVRNAVLTADGSLLVQGLENGRLEWWDAVRGYRLDEMVAHNRGVGGLDFSPDGRTLASGSQDGVVALWDTRTPRRIARWKADLHAVHGLAFAPDGKSLAICGNEAVRLFDLRTQREVLTLHAPASLFLWVGFSSDGGALLCGASDRHCYLWRPPSFAELETAR